MLAMDRRKLKAMFSDLLLAILLCTPILLVCCIIAYFTSWLTVVLPVILGYWYVNRDLILTHEDIEKRKKLSVVIIGGGVSGICAAIKLKQQRIPFVILEKSSEIGGTWRENQYPGCRCDVMAHFYSFSFFLNPFWSKSTPSYSELLEYLHNTCEYYDIDKYIKLNTKVEKCKFDKDTKLWSVFTSNDGEEIKCNYLISGIGYLREPRFPDIPGQDLFQGDSMHTAKWRKDYDYRNKTVGIIGTGASSTQVIPTIASKVKHLYVFQRTPIWVFPYYDLPYPFVIQKLFQTFPFLMILYRWFIFIRQELIFCLAFTTGTATGKSTQDFMIFFIKEQVHDPNLRNILIPDYELGCKRGALSLTYLPVFNRQNVTLINKPIKIITKDGIELQEEGVGEISLDSIIYATGFDLLKSVNGVDIHRPEDNKLLSEIWQNTPNAYKGIMCPGFPNFFLLLGPGTSLGHNSVVCMIECQVNYVLDAITRTTNDGYSLLQVKDEANEVFQSYMRNTVKDRVFGSGCKSYYQNSDGYSYVLWPSYVISYWWQTLWVDFQDFIRK